MKYLSLVHHRILFFFVSSFSQRSGFLGWGGDKSEIINGYEAKIYNVSGIEVITRTRTEHMSERDREKFKGFLIKIFLVAKY